MTDGMCTSLIQDVSVFVNQVALFIILDSLSPSFTMPVSLQSASVIKVPSTIKAPGAKIPNGARQHRPRTTASDTVHKRLVNDEVRCLSLMQVSWAHTATYGLYRNVIYDIASKNSNPRQYLPLPSSHTRRNKNSAQSLMNNQ
jgi:hypothetical protein